LKLVWRASARADLQRQLTYVHARSPRAAARLERRVLQRIADLREFPDAGRVGRASHIRELVVSRTPHIVVFRREAQLITILAVFHHAQQR
jgi:toxin ParE1/3/4